MADRAVNGKQERLLEELEKVAFAPAGDGSGSELKYSNKLKALEMLARLLGLQDRPVEGQGEGQTGVVLMPEVGQEYAGTTPQSPQSGDSCPPGGALAER